MDFKNLKIIENMSEDNLPSLSEVTLAALELFIKDGLPKVKFENFKKPIVVGSGNAKVTSQILFSGTNAVFADENNFEETLKMDGIDGVLVFSASGSKHAPILVKKAQDKGFKVQLISCNENSPASELLTENQIIVTPKNLEPYTYNTSTYMGWILAKTSENPKEIYDFIINSILNKIPTNLNKYNGFLLVTENRFERVNNLFDTKFVELFGRRIARDVKTFEELKHAITVVPYEKELCIEFGVGDEIIYQGDKLIIPIPKNCSIATMMAIGYFVIGKIQEQNIQYFKENIKSYVKIAKSKGSFGKGIEVIV